MGIFQSIKRGIRSTDRLLLFLCFAASAFGALMVHSATLYKLHDGELISKVVIVMIGATLVGILLGMIASFIDYEMLLRLWLIIGGVSLIMMLLLFPFGSAANPDRPDARTWFDLGIVSFQPSELFKIAFIITFTVHLDYVGDKINEFKNVVLLTIHGLIPAFIVVATGDLGSALIFLSIFVGMMFISGLSFKYFAIAAAILVVAIPTVWFGFFSEFQKARFLAVWAPDTIEPQVYKDIIYQQQHGINAIGSGKLFGQGLFNGPFTQSHYVPVSESDMIFSVIAEELGFVGALCSIGLIALIIVKIVMVGIKSKDNIGTLLCFGVAIMIGVQTIINIGVCLKLFPSIGITLPFYSAGGSSNLCIYIAIGIVLSVYRFNQKNEATSFRYNKISTPFR